MPTLAQAEATLVGPAPDAGAGLVGAALASVGFLATGPSPVASLAPAISAALAACGITPTDVTAPADADLAGLTGEDWFKFLDIAGLLLLEQAVFASTGTLKVEDWPTYRKERFGPADLIKLLEQKRKAVQIAWNYGGAKMTTGTIRIRARPSASEM